MKNTLLFFILIQIFISDTFGQAMPKGIMVGVSLGRPYLSGHNTAAPSNFSQVFVGFGFNWTGSVFTLTPRLSVQRNLFTTNQYFNKIGSDYYFTETPNDYLNNRLMTYIATLGIGLSVHRTISSEIKIELLMEPQLGKNIVNTQLYFKDGQSQKNSVSNNPLVFGGEITLWLTKKCSCGGLLMTGPGVLLQNGSYIKGDNFRSITPIVSLAMRL